MIIGILVGYAEYAGIVLSNLKKLEWEYVLEDTLI